VFYEVVTSSLLLVQGTTMAEFQLKFALPPSVVATAPTSPEKGKRSASGTPKKKGQKRGQQDEDDEDDDVPLVKVRKLVCSWHFVCTVHECVC
jgi:hypothetical protein